MLGVQVIFRLVLYKRYIDDTIILVRSEAHIRPFVDYLNSQRQNMEIC